METLSVLTPVALAFQYSGPSLRVARRDTSLQGWPATYPDDVYREHECMF